MDAVLRVQSSEFNDELINKIKTLLEGAENSEITISITEKPSLGILRHESREAYFSRLEDSLKHLENGNVITFNGDSFDHFAKHLAGE